jgi:cytochrome c oxidase subunit II
MKTTLNRRRLVGISFLVAAGAITFSLAAPSMKTGSPVRTANASQEPRVIEIKAKKFEFSPSEITLKKGEPVILRLTTADRTHGFLIKPLKIDADIVPGKATDIAVTPEQAGDYTIICDHYCGIGHGNMKVKVSVVE